MAIIDAVTATIPPLMNPIVSIMYMIGLIFIPVLLKLVFLAQEGRFDNQNPREMIDKVKNASKRSRLIRCQSAHQNGWEALTIFAPAVLSAIITDVDKKTLSSLCTAFIIVRAIYIPLYVFGTINILSSMRSMSFAIGMYLSVSIMSLAALKMEDF